MLGEGANSSVFSVSSNKTSYALKVTSMVHLPDERYDWKVLLDLLKEICILNVMKLSDYCVHVYDSVYYGSLLGMILDEGYNLHRIITVDRPTDIQKKDIVIGLCAGLSHIHSISLIHCDIKPQNVIVIKTSGRGRAEEDVYIPKLIDFGSTLLISSPPAPFGGTFDFVPPEVIQTQLDRESFRINAIPSMDIWALGLCVVFISSGIYPFKSRGVWNPWLIMDILQYINTICKSRNLATEFIKSTENKASDITVAKLTGPVIKSLTPLIRNEQLLLVAQGCLQINPTERKSASELLSLLSEGNDVVADYNNILSEGDYEVFRNNLNKIQEWGDHITGQDLPEGQFVSNDNFLGSGEVFEDKAISETITSIVNNTYLKDNISEDIIIHIEFNTTELQDVRGLGFKLSPTTTGTYIVKEVDTESIAYDKGVREYMSLVSLNKKPMPTTERLPTISTISTMTNLSLVFRSPLPASK